MGTRKTGSELVFNLQWRDELNNGSDKSNVIGMYDTPETTLSFKSFKSYLLKNSGVAANDVRVTFTTDVGPDYLIDGQSGFQIAICAFRLKARLGEVIYLTLDKIYGSKMNRKVSNDVETQYEEETSLSIDDCDFTPEWFITYMTQFKKDVIEEFTAVVSVNTAQKEPQITPQPVTSTPPKRTKSDSSKRSRKHILGEASIDKDVVRKLKYEGRLESKLDKLDAKSKKIKEKKQALISRTIVDSYKHHLPISAESDGKPTMNAAWLFSDASSIPRMVGGETYLHSWQVKNNGNSQWTKNTLLRLTWGSADMKPATNIIKCPTLKPGDKGTISVRFEIPKKPGQYESYWNFYERNVRFGQWLSCSVIVEAPIAFTTPDFTSKKPKIEVVPESSPKNIFPSAPVDISTPTPIEHNFVFVQEPEGATALDCNVADLSSRLQEIKLQGAHYCAESDSDWESLWSYGGTKILHRTQPTTTYTETDLDGSTNKYGIDENELLVELPKKADAVAEVKIEANSESAVVSDGLVKASNDDNNNNGASVNNNSSEESICEGSDASSDLSSGYDIITGPVCEEPEESSGYVYITIDGNKLSVPRHILRPDFLAIAEEAPAPETSGLEDLPCGGGNPFSEAERPLCLEAEKLKANIAELEENTKSFMSHCSTAGTCFSEVNGVMEGSRYFIFPQAHPGYEVLLPNDERSKSVGCSTSNVDVLPTDPMQTYTWAQSQSQYALSDLQRTCVYAATPLEHSRSASTTSSTARGATAQGPTVRGSTAQGPTVRGSTAQGTATQGPTAQDATPPIGKSSNQTPPRTPTTPKLPPRSQVSPTGQVHILPENLVSGAVNVASSAINTARSVINMIVPPKSEPGTWVNGHWVSGNPECNRSKNLRTLTEMGFWDTDLNATLLGRYNDDIARVVSELIQ